MSEMNKKYDGGSREGYTPSNHDGEYNRQRGGNYGRNFSSEGNRGRHFYGDERPNRYHGMQQEHRDGSYGPQRGGFQRGGQQRQDGEGYGRQRGGFQRDGQQRRPWNSEGSYQQRGGYRGGYGAQQGGYGQRGGGQRRSYNHDGGHDGGFASQNVYAGEGFRPQTSEGSSYGQQRGGYRGGYGAQQGGYGQQRGYGQQSGRKPAPFKRQNPGKRRIDYKEQPYDPNEPIRLNKFLANAGVCSRRDADKYIAAGVVTVNGEIITELGRKVLRSDTVLFHDQQVKAEKKVYVLLNKPKGYVTTSEDPQNRKTVMDLVAKACRERIYPVGRLDRNTTGVLLLTNDGELASKLTHPTFMKKKIYHVYLDRNVTAADIRQIAEGITLEDGEIAADAIDYASDTDKKQVGIEIHSGRNRIVRRIFESLGYHVVKLDRVYFAGLTKKNVKRGDWRFLTEEEVNMLRMGAFE